MQVIPLQAIPSQTFTVQLAQQTCTMWLRQIETGTYLDLTVNGAPVVTGKRVHDRCRIVRRPHLPFVGDLAMVDTQGADEPDHTGLGDRWVLMYLEAADL